MTFSPRYNRQTGEPYPRQLTKDEGFWSRTDHPYYGWCWERKGYLIKDVDLRKKGITNWLSLGEDMQWEIAEEFNRERINQLREDTLKKVQKSKMEWQEKHGTN
jgi:hypothetical protein